MSVLKNRSQLTKRWPVLLGVLVIALLGLMWLRALKRPPEPVYSGHQLGYWLAVEEEYDESVWEDDVVGDTSAVPFLIKALAPEGRAVAYCRKHVWPRLPALMQRHVQSPAAVSRARLAALDLLGKKGPAAAAAIPALLRALRDANPDVRTGAIRALGNVGTEDGAVVPAFSRALRDKDSWVRHTAASALGRIRNGDPVVSTALVQALNDTDWHVRQRVTEAIGEIGMGSNNTIDALAAALGDADRNVRKGAAEALGKVGHGNERAALALTAALKHDDESTRWTAAVVLGQVGTENRDVILRLTEAEGDRNEIVRRMATNALLKIKARAAAAAGGSATP